MTYSGFESRFRGRIALMVLGLIWACSFQKEKAEEGSEVADFRYEEEIAQILSSGFQQMPIWESYWKRFDPTFGPGSLQIGKRVDYEVLEWPEDNFIQKDSPFFPYLVSHPEGLGVVDIYSYKVVIPEEGEVAFNPDSEVIFFKSNGMRERILFIGPSGGFQEARWVTGDYLMVSGFFEYENGIGPMVWLVNVTERNYQEYASTVRISKYPKGEYLKEKLENIPFPQDAIDTNR